jgi:pyrroline-5-carboxylate reductase
MAAAAAPPAVPPPPPSLLGARSVGFIGAGNMATALVQGLLARGLCAPAQLRVSSPSGPSRALQALGVHCGTDNRAVAAASDVLVLAVKPFKLAEVVAALAAAPAGAAGAFRPGCVLVSIASGVSTSTLQAMLAKAGYFADAAAVQQAKIYDTFAANAYVARNPCPRVLRVMPNTPAQVLAGASAMCPGARSERADLALVRELFEAVGAVQQVEEKHMDAVTGLSGSGPAYVMLFIEALADGAVMSGLPRPMAMALALQLVKGAAQMAQQTGQHPGALKDAVASPGGTTIAGIHALEVGAFRGSVMSAVVAASRRATELGAAERA